MADRNDLLIGSLEITAKSHKTIADEFDLTHTPLNPTTLHLLEKNPNSLLNQQYAACEALYIEMVWSFREQAYQTFIQALKERKFEEVEFLLRKILCEEKEKALLLSDELYYKNQQQMLHLSLTNYLSVADTVKDKVLTSLMLELTYEEKAITAIQVQLNTVSAAKQGLKKQFTRTKRDYADHVISNLEKGIMIGGKQIKFNLSQDEKDDLKNRLGTGLLPTDLFNTIEAAKEAYTIEWQKQCDLILKGEERRLTRGEYKQAYAAAQHKFHILDSAITKELIKIVPFLLSELKKNKENANLMSVLMQEQHAATPVRALEKLWTPMLINIIDCMKQEENLNEQEAVCRFDLETHQNNCQRVLNNIKDRGEELNINIEQFLQQHNGKEPATKSKPNYSSRSGI